MKLLLGTFIDERIERYNWHCHCLDVTDIGVVIFWH